MTGVQRHAEMLLDVGRWPSNAAGSRRREQQCAGRGRSELRRRHKTALVARWAAVRSDGSGMITVGAAAAFQAAWA